MRSRFSWCPILKMLQMSSSNIYLYRDSVDQPAGVWPPSVTAVMSVTAVTATTAVTAVMAVMSVTAVTAVMAVMSVTAMTLSLIHI